MLKELMQERQKIEHEIAVLEAQLENVNVDISDLLSMQLEAVRKAQGKEFGAVNVVSEGYRITETIPKRVKWNQEKMAEIFQTIMQHGDKPSNYMRMELTVPEKVYDKFDAGTRGVFDEARIIEKGRPSLKIEEVEHA